MKNFEQLISQGIVETGVSLETSFIEQQSDYSLWGLLVNSGYLTVVEAEDDFLMKLRIPNEEVASEFQKMVAVYAHIENSELTGQVLCIGLAHNKKQCAMAHKIIEAE